jgi:hypothetical protein
MCPGRAATRSSDPVVTRSAPLEPLTQVSAPRLQVINASVSPRSCESGFGGEDLLSWW